MRKSLIVGLMLLLVAGCSEDGAAITKAMDTCEANGGLDKVSTFGGWYECKNGALFSFGN